MIFRDQKLAAEIINKIKEKNVRIRVMHVCGTHQDTLVRFGLRDMLLEAGVDMREGPGCPVCVTTPMEIEEALELASRGKVITTFGDMYRVPGMRGALKDSKGDVRIVYSVDDSIEIANKTDKDVIFLGVGFETTMPSIASSIIRGVPENFYLLSFHRLTPPAVMKIAEMGELNLDGIIDPGHVSTIIGKKPWEPISKKFDIPQVIAGFEPLDLLMAVLMIIKQIENGEAKVEIEYTRAVREEGNPKAQELIYQVFEKKGVKWRGFPEIEESGMFLKKEFEDLDARKAFEDLLQEVWSMDVDEPKGCRCGEVIRGLIQPWECPLFGKVCTPDKPVGPCMVSREGACYIEYKFSSP